MNSESVISALAKLSHPDRAKSSTSFFKTGPGQYGEGDKFIGVTVPEMRKVAKAHLELGLKDVQELLNSDIHEHRLTGAMILVYQFEKADAEKQKAIYDFYLRNTRNINNWDIVDTSAAYIVGAYLSKSDDISVLVELAGSKDLWERRIAIIATLWLIQERRFAATQQIAEILLHDSHDLIHKAVGWMLREMGKRNLKAETDFLDKYYQEMPRTMLRYAIERFSPAQKAHYMKR